MQFDPLQQFRELCFKHFLRAFEQKVTAAARSTAAQNQHMLDIIKICIMSNAIAKINPHALPYLQSAFMACFQFFLAPTDRAGNNPDPSRAPHVINNSWGCPPEEGCTTPNIMQTVVENVRNAGILVVASAGNSGSGCSTVADPPAIYAASYSVGNLNGTSVAGTSSRGPVTVDGSNRIKPDISAPGTSVRSSTRNGAYASFSGTSMAGPHVAGVAALLMSVDPTLKRDPARIEALLSATAVNDITTVQNCGGTASPGTIPNNTFGHGRVDALNAARVGLGLLNASGFE